MRISDWSSDVCSSDLVDEAVGRLVRREIPVVHQLDRPDARREHYEVAIAAGHQCSGGASAGLVGGLGARHRDEHGSTRVGYQIEHLTPAVGQRDHHGVVRGWLQGGGPAARGLLPTQSLVACDGHRSEEQTSELQSLMRISYAVFCLK